MANGHYIIVKLFVLTSIIYLKSLGNIGLSQHSFSILPIEFQSQGFVGWLFQVTLPSTSNTRYFERQRGANNDKGSCGEGQEDEIAERG
jgi:hypothetical protein